MTSPGPKAPPPIAGIGRPFYGKYRGKVLFNIDPLMLGRIIASVPAVSGSLLNWAMPCVPYAGPQVGFYAIPPIGANVWIEFEGGDPKYPIWTGCFWSEGETPITAAGPPEPMVKVFKTETITLILNDLPEVGGFTVLCTPPSVATPLSMTFNSIGVEINATPALFTMAVEEGITMTYPPSIVEMTAAEIEVAIPESSLTLTPVLTELLATDVSVTATAAIELEAAANFSASAGAALELSAGAEASLEAGAACEISAGAELALTAAGAAELTAAAVAVTGAIEITGAVEALGAIAVTGAVEVAGGVLIDGMPPMLI